MVAMPLLNFDPGCWPQTAQTPWGHGRSWSYLPQTQGKGLATSAICWTHAAKRFRVQLIPADVLQACILYMQSYVRECITLPPDYICTLSFFFPVFPAYDAAVVLSCLEFFLEWKYFPDSKIWTPIVVLGSSVASLHFDVGYLRKAELSRKFRGLMIRILWLRPGVHGIRPGLGHMGCSRGGLLGQKQGAQCALIWVVPCLEGPKFLGLDTRGGGG